MVSISGTNKACVHTRYDATGTHNRSAVWLAWDVERCHAGVLPAPPRLDIHPVLTLKISEIHLTFLSPADEPSGVTLEVREASTVFRPIPRVELLSKKWVWELCS